VEIEVIRSLAAHLSQSDLTELEFLTSTSAIRLVRTANGCSNAANSDRGRAESDKSALAVSSPRSPTVGTFIAEHPITANPFVKVGSPVNQGDVMGLITYGNFIRAVEAAGTGVVSNVLVESGSPVGFGQILFEIELRSNV
jgi:biotin carboxyl carrier protein